MKPRLIVYARLFDSLLSMVSNAADGRKPNSVRLRPCGLRRDDHSSRPGIADGLKRPTRKLRTGRPLVRLRSLARASARHSLPIWSCSVRGFACHLPYSRRGALLPHLFTLTRLRPSGYDAAGLLRGLPRRSARERAEAGGIFSVPLILQVALTGRYPAHCPAEFGLSSPPSRLAAVQRGDHLADCDSSIVRHLPIQGFGTGD